MEVAAGGSRWSHGENADENQRPQRPSAVTGPWLRRLRQVRTHPRRRTLQTVVS